MTPFEIDILLHFHTTPTDYPNRNSALYSSIVDIFLKNGLIVEDSAGLYFTTARGVAHVQQLCSLPWPVSQWVDQNGKVIEDN